jgi:predicted RNase H-like HicB family nuclease
VEGFEKAVEQFARFAQTKRRQFQTIDSLMSNVRQLEKRIVELSAQPFQVLITTLAPEPFDLKRDIPIIVAPNGEDFIATFFDAGISATGDTDEEAVFNLKDLIVQTFEALSKIPEAKLGVLPRKQLAVLRTLVVPQVGGQ